MFKRFCRDRRGSLPIMTAVLAIPMIVTVGAGIDFMHHETVRTKLQDSLDRGVLAAASLSQSQDGERTIRSFLSNAGIEGYELTVRQENHVNRRKVEADAQLRVETSFLGLVGIRDIGVSAVSSAEESRTNIEISLLLDMSGSMRDNGGIDQLRPAARDFIDTILEEDVRSVTSVNLVPYAGQVSVGSRMFNMLAGGFYKNRRRGVDAGTTNCFEFLNTDYTIGLPFFPDRKQTQQFTWYNKGQEPAKQPWWCPNDDTSVRFLQNDPEKLKAMIDGLKLYDGTGTAIAMKWAAMALDPSFRLPLLSARTLGIVDTPFTTRPSAFNDEGTKKFVVLMTDGVIGDQFRPKDDRIDKTYRYLWEMQWAYGKIDVPQWQTRSQLLGLCRQLKDKGVEIYSIGFKLASGSTFHKDLSDCASRPENYHAVDGLDINDAFQSIATDIKRIRLTT